MPSAVLAIETSTPQGSVAVVREGEVVCSETFISERSHNSQLFVPLRKALKAAGEDLVAVVVGTGPASYTGVRIGIAAGQGVALVREVPVFGMPSLLAVDEEAASDWVVCGDARRGLFFLADVRSGSLPAGVLTCSAEDLRQLHRERCTGRPWYTFDAKVPLMLENVSCVTPAAARLARRAAAMPPGEVKRLANLPLEPVYLSAPFVTMPRK